MQTNELIDRYQRRFAYLRLSLTERCNFKCQYCLPQGYQSDQKKQFLSLSEIDHLLAAFSTLGVKKIRLTGGEPTLRRDFNAILEKIASYPSFNEIALTTNGSRLDQHIETWKALGLTAINVSIDSLSPSIYHELTGENKLSQILSGIDHALAIHFPRIKINTVLMKGKNDQLADYLDFIRSRPIEWRFIEFMETAQLKTSFNTYHISGQKIATQLLEQGWQLQPHQTNQGPAKVYAHPDYLGKIGLIQPYETHFCDGCNRLRVSSLGQLHYCLFGESAVDLRPYLQKEDQKEALIQAIFHSLAIKPASHHLKNHQAGLIQNLSMIGG